MVKIEALIHPHRLDSVKTALGELGIGHAIISDVSDHGGQGGGRVFYRGAEYFVDAPRTKVEIIVSSLQVEEVIAAVSQAARTPGSTDDGIILLYEVADAIQIKDGHRLPVSVA